MSDTSSGNDWELVTESLPSSRSPSPPANPTPPPEVAPACAADGETAVSATVVGDSGNRVLVESGGVEPRSSPERKPGVIKSSSGSDWELVTGALSAHQSFTASSSADAASAADGGAVDANVRSGYFATPEVSLEPLKHVRSGYFATSEVGVEPPKPVEDVATYAVEDPPPSKQVEEIDFSRGILVSESCHELSKLDWMEPRSPGRELLEYEGSGLGSSTSNSDGHSHEIKDGLEPYAQQVGPLLGSCVSAPFSPTIVSRDNSFRLNLSDEIVADAASQREVDPDTLASVEHEMLLLHSAFISPNSFSADMDKMGVPLEDSALSQERAAEIWWNKQSALRGVHGRQANTYWSIALAAAVMGLVILGHRWQYERRQNQQLRLRLHLKEEKIGQLVLQLARMKEMLSGRRRVPVLRSNYGSYDRY